MVYAVTASFKSVWGPYGMRHTDTWRVTGRRKADKAVEDVKYIIAARHMGFDITVKSVERVQ